MDITFVAYVSGPVLELDVNEAPRYIGIFSVLLGHSWHEKVTVYLWEVSFSRHVVGINLFAMEVKPVIPEKLVIGMISRQKELFDQASVRLAQVFGELDFTSQIMKFDYTDYYQDEFGPDLKRKFIAFKRLISPERLAEIKCLTNLIEKEFSLKRPQIKEGANLQRQINLDPGLLSAGKFILATTKDQQHRIYLGRGIYAEVTLRYQKGTFRPNEWTYPDYRSPEYIEIFNQIRKLYRQQVLSNIKY